MNNNNDDELRKKAIEKAKEMAYKLKSQGKEYDAKKILMAAIGSVVIGGGSIAGINLIKNAKTGAKSEPSKKAVVKNVNTNLYSELPDRNMVDRLDKNEIIIYKKDDFASWEQNGEKTIDFIKVSSVLENMDVVEENDEYIVKPQNEDSIKSYDEKALYVLRSAIDEYVECQVKEPALKFRAKASTEEEDYCYANEGTLYVCLDGEGKGAHNFKKAILVLPNGDLKRGFVADENDYVMRKEDSTVCFGVANDYTYLRNTAALPEFDEEYIHGLIKNGEVIEIVDDADQYCYKCKVANSDEEFYIRKNTVTLFDDFDFEVEYDASSVEYTGTIYGFANDGSLIERTDEDGNPKKIAKGDRLKVDINSSKDGYYSVYDETQGVVGFVEGELLRELDTKKTIIDIVEPNSEVDSIPVESEYDSSSENSETSNGEIEVKPDGEDKVSITINAKFWTKGELEKLLNYYENKGIEVSGIFFSIGATWGDNSFCLANIQDTDEAYEKYQNDRTFTSIQKVCDQINEKSNTPIAKYSHSRGNMADLQKNVELAIQKGIPIGMFYYSAPTNEDEVSCEAAYIYGVVKYLNENSKLYREYDKKLPMGIDIECNDSGGFRESQRNTRRAELSQKLIELLGSGVKEDSSKYFCIDKKDPSQGYNVINKGAMIYGDIRGYKNIENDNKMLDILNSPKGKVKNYWEMKDNLESEGYIVYLWGSELLSGVKHSAKGTPLDENDLNKLQDLDAGKKALDISKEEKLQIDENRKLYDQCVVLQIMLDKNVGGIKTDISYTLNSNIEAMINEVPLPKSYKFEDAFEFAIQDQPTAEVNQEEDDFSVEVEYNDDLTL